tara:strand:+ start:1218 stop:1427 length:210 start_codon:yes stop_codon:yes gene_type:complete
MSQIERVENHLKQGKSITRLQALTELGIFELSARLVDLEKAGYVIDRKWVKVTNRFGESARVKEYWINE